MLSNEANRKYLFSFAQNLQVLDLNTVLSYYITSHNNKFLQKGSWLHQKAFCLTKRTMQFADQS